MTIRTACSAAMVGLNEACVAISRGDCEGALVGGTNLIMTPGMTTMLSSQGVLSKDGSCKTFSAEADGYARAEALAAIYIKPLHLAQRDGNPIRAIIRATAVNHDGRTPGIYQPSYHAQENLMRTAYRLAGISDFGETAMVECHGTGTPTGDPIETRAIASVFGKYGVYIGSIKPNVGHSEGASGVTSIIKMVMALENRTIPPNIKFTTPNPDIPFEAAKLSVPTEALPWPQSRKLRVSINSFGVSGTNAHVILESVEGFQDRSNAVDSVQKPQLLLYSAATGKSLSRLKDQYRDWAKSNPTKLDDLSYTLAHRREHLHFRTYAVAHKDGVNDAPEITKISDKPRLVMVFTGQGAQWPQMGRELFELKDVFRSVIQSLDQCLRDSLGGSSPYSIEEELFKPANESHLSSASISQPLCTALQLALVDLLRSVGVVADAVVGHSSGEIAAAYAAGSLTAQEAITIAHHRGAIASRQTKPGSMAAIGLGHEEVQGYLGSGVSVACHNSPKSTTISGDTPAVQGALAKIQQSHPGVLAKMLLVDKAYHSSHMAEIGDEYQSSLERAIHARPPNIPFFSSVTGKRLTKDQELGSSYWKTNLVSPVLFNEAVDTLVKGLGQDNAVFLEVGPHSALAGPLRQIFASKPYPYVPTIVRNNDSVASFLATVGSLFSLGFQLNLEALIPVKKCLPDLPRYPWNHEETYWLEPRVSKEWRLRKHAYHNLLGAKVPESTDIEPSWRNLLHIQNIPWIRDHRIGDNLVFPFSGYLSMAGEAISQITGEKQCYRVRNFNADVALVLFEGAPTEIITTLHPHRLTNSQNSDWWDFTITSFNGHVWTKHCKGQVSALASDLDQIKNPLSLYSYPKQVVASSWYKGIHRVGVNLGPSFQALTEIATTMERQSAICVVDNGRHGDENDYHIHPTALDVVFQLPAVAAVNGRTRLLKNWVPISIRDLTVRRCNSNMKALTDSSLTSNGFIEGEGWCTSAGDVTIKFSGVRLSPADGLTTNELLDTHAAARLEWRRSLDFISEEFIRVSESRTKTLRAVEELFQLHVLSIKLCDIRKIASEGQSERLQAWTTAMQFYLCNNNALGEEGQSFPEAQMIALESELRSTQACCVVKALRAVQAKLDGIPPDIKTTEFISNELTEEINKFIYDADITEFLLHMRHHRPGLRILEIGLGTTSLAESIVQALARADGNTFISRYTTTSTCFKENVPKGLQSIGLEYSQLDICEDSSSQGFEDREYDLIVMRPDPSPLANTAGIAANVRKLLSSYGRLLVQEVPQSWLWARYLFCEISNWPCDQLIKSVSMVSALTANGFQIDGRSKSRLNGASFDNVSNQTMTVLKKEDPPAAARKVTFLQATDETTKSPLISHFQQLGYEVTECSLTDTPLPGQDIISVLDGEAALLETLDEAQYNSFNTFLQRLQDCGIIWVTPHSQLECSRPAYGQIIGLARTLRSEMILDFATCEVNYPDMELGRVVDVFEHFQRRRVDDAAKPEFEYAIKDGQVYTGRYYPFALKNELTTHGPGDRAVLDIDLPGRLSTIHWVAGPRDELESDEVEIEVHTAGLNFKAGTPFSFVLSYS